MTQPMEVGVVFWTGGELGVVATPMEIAESVRSLGLSCGQLGVHGGADVGPEAQKAWKEALEAHGIRVTTAFMNFEGESYATMPICAQTVGYVPEATRAEREKRTYEVSDFAAAIGIPGLGAHVGAVPEDTDDPAYIAVRDLTRRMCDHCAGNNQTFALETGQESAEALVAFFKDVDRTNLHINFDPANMILYGSGEPMEALETVKQWVLSVHCKDGVRSKVPGEWGQETPLGAGEVGMERYIAKLKQIGYEGPLTIEREIVGEEQREDITQAAALLKRLRDKA